MERDDILDIIDTPFERTISDAGNTLFFAAHGGIGEPSFIN